MPAEHLGRHAFPPTHLGHWSGWPCGRPLHHRTVQHCHHHHRVTFIAGVKKQFLYIAKLFFLHTLYKKT
jgi:hypothetical protein